MFFLFSLVFAGLCVSVSSVDAQESWVHIKELRGRAIVMIQHAKVREARKGDVLRYGDQLETEAGATVTLALPNGNRLLIQENMVVDFANMNHLLFSGEWKSYSARTEGKMHIFLDPRQLAEGYTFMVKTPNALLAIPFPQSDIQMNYNPYTSTTFVATHSANVLVLNLATNEMKTVYRGNSAQVQGVNIWTAPIYGEVFSQPRSTLASAASQRQGKSSILGTSASQPATVQAKSVQSAQIRQVSNPAERTGRPESSRPIPHHVTITINR
jgi:hypothetical protein